MHQSDPSAVPPSRGVLIELTPAAAFAAGALAVAALGLAFVLGRRLPPATPTIQAKSTSGALRTLDEVRRLPPIRYDELLVDRGTAP